MRPGIAPLSTSQSPSLPFRSRSAGSASPPSLYLELRSRSGSRRGDDPSRVRQHKHKREHERGHVYTGAQRSGLRMLPRTLAPIDPLLGTLSPLFTPTPTPVLTSALSDATIQPSTRVLTLSMAIFTGPRQPISSHGLQAMMRILTAAAAISTLNASLRGPDTAGVVQGDGVDDADAAPDDDDDDDQSR